MFQVMFIFSASAVAENRFSKKRCLVKWVISLYLKVTIRTWGRVLKGSGELIKMPRLNPFSRNVDNINLLNYGGMYRFERKFNRHSREINTKEFIEIWKDVWLRLFLKGKSCNWHYVYYFIDLDLQSEISSKWKDTMKRVVEMDDCGTFAHLYRSFKKIWLRACLFPYCFFVTKNSF